MSGFSDGLIRHARDLVRNHGGISEGFSKSLSDMLTELLELRAGLPKRRMKRKNTRPASPALDRLKELVDGPDGLNWIHAKLKDLYSAAHVDPEQISERMARDIVRAVHEGGDEILDEFARIKLGLSRALRIIEEL